MIKTIKHAVNVVRAAIHEHEKNTKRSSEWPKVEHAFRKDHGTCAACGGNKRLQVHHKKPFHLHPELELNPLNLISLCMGTNECHLLIGHGDNFKMYNPNVEKDSNEALLNPSKRTEIEDRAKKNRLS